MVATAGPAFAGAPSTQDAMVEVRDLVKIYRGGVRAVDAISFAVREAEFFGFLGPNGAGKTTTIRILATLLRQTSGSAFVAGLDVSTQGPEIRRRIGFAMQSVGLDNLSTGRENLEIIGRLYRMPGRELTRRMDELLQLVNLTDAAKKLVGTYSGGMKRRLDLATALLHRPVVLFLDEPTEGLDPQSRSALWDELRAIGRAGTTMFLTTHYMEEADRLCERVAIIDDGRIVVEGSPAELRRAIGSDLVELRLGADGPSALEERRLDVARLLEDFPPLTRLERVEGGVALYVTGGAEAIPEIVRRLDGNGVTIAALTMSHPTLDDVFLKYTGKRIRAEEANQPLVTWWPE
ncbi:MAG TPA: ATP-binding cassette domain-containing protein [Candidatus Limnocylindrales bacterium]|nr:ATP-binding cassette domain-containing protein [Candidatus Limnocylindrales bacterium]